MLTSYRVTPDVEKGEVTLVPMIFADAQKLSAERY